MRINQTNVRRLLFAGAVLTSAYYLTVVGIIELKKAVGR